MDDYDIEEIQNPVWPKAYKTENGSVFYIKDTMPMSPEIGDFTDDRYKVMARESFRPDDGSMDYELNEYDDLDAAEEFLDEIIHSLQD